MQAPLFSTITLFTEIGVTAAVIFIFFQGMKHNRFPARIAFFTLAYEILFNISYMVYSSMHKEATAAAKTMDLKTGVAIFHGILSLVMFLALIVFIVLAYRGYKKGSNFFRAHRTLTYTFLVFWLAAVLSGFGLYIISYGHW